VTRISRKAIITINKQIGPSRRTTEKDLCNTLRDQNRAAQGMGENEIFPHSPLLN